MIWVITRWQIYNYLYVNLYTRIRMLLMTVQNLILGLHLLAALLWMAGHLALLAYYIPKAQRGNNTGMLRAAYNTYKGMALALLAVLAATGIALAGYSGIAAREWLCFDTAHQRTVSIKLVLLGLTAIFAWSTRYGVMPKLQSGELNLLPLIYHAACITLFSMLLVAFQYIS